MAKMPPEPDALKIIHQPVDYCAVNLYFGNCFKAGARQKRKSLICQTSNINFIAAITDILALGTEILMSATETILIIESGMSWNDTVSPDGHVHDMFAQFIHDYLTACQLSMTASKA